GGPGGPGGPGPGGPGAPVGFASPGAPEAPGPGGGASASAGTAGPRPWWRWPWWRRAGGPRRSTLLAPPTGDGWDILVNGLAEALWATDAARRAGPPRRAGETAGPGGAREAFEKAQRDAAEEFAAALDRADERDRLVMVCVDLADRLRVHHAGLFAVLRDGLAEVGVTLTVADGERFDATRHRAIGREPTEDPERHMTVARTQLCGVTDRDRRIRTPEVVVYAEAEQGDA
ncbi:hypothetical protein ABGB17_29680, partial [Sphaerisporangium sp. B11E5]